jgi:hypothetical protein
MPEPMRCPVCKADNTQGPACRRCKADLSLLWDLETRRERLLASARNHLQHGEWQLAVNDATFAEQLRSGADAGQLVAAARLLGCEFAGAWFAYRAIRAHFVGSRESE